MITVKRTPPLGKGDEIMTREEMIQLLATIHDELPVSFWERYDNAKLSKQVTVAQKWLDEQADEQLAVM